MIHLFRRVRRLPWVAAVVATLGRYTRRHGFQYAGAITYFSVLSLIPIIMFAGAATGFTLTVLRPDWLASLQQIIIGALGDSELADAVVLTFDRAVRNWQGLLGVAVVMAAYSGVSWIANLRVGLNAMIKTMPVSQLPWWRGLLRDLGDFCVLLSLLVAVAGVIAMHLAWLNPAGGLGWLIRTVLVYALGWLLMAFLYLRLPRTPIGWRSWLPASLLGAAAITGLQQAGSWVIHLFGENPVALLFGPILAAMVLFNLFAVILLLCFAATGEGLARQQARAVDKDRPSEG